MSRDISFGMPGGEQGYRNPGRQSSVREEEKHG
jgi:hypothetical protein